MIESKRNKTAVIGREPSFFRIWQIVGNKERGLVPILPIGKSTFWRDVKAGLITQPVKLGPRTSVWPSTEIQAISQARTAGQSDYQIKALVKKLHEDRQAGA